MSIKKTLSLLMIFSIFSGGFIFGRGTVELYWFYLLFAVFLVLFFLRDFKIYINKTFLKIFLVVCVISVINLFLYHLSIALVLKQVFGIMISVSAYYLLFKINNYNVDKLFRWYLIFAFVVCLIGIFQEISFLLHFTPGYDYSSIIHKYGLANRKDGFPLLRINSIMVEASHFAIALTPAMYVALNNLLSKKCVYINKTKSWIIMIAYLLSFSAVGYMGIFASLLLILYKRFLLGSFKQKVSYLLIIIFLPTVFVFGSYTFITSIRNRVNDALLLLKGQGIRLNNAGLSTFALYSNTMVTIESLKKNPLFGSALGNYIKNHRRYISKIFPEYANNPWARVNQEDANSLALRLLAETGIFGLLIVLYFIKKYFIALKKQPEDPDDLLDVKYVLINNGILILLLLRLFRNGHYFSDGLFFFVFLYYFSGRFFKERKLSLVLERGDGNA